MARRPPEGATLSFLRGVSLYRWTTWVWMAVVAVLHADEMRGRWAWLAVALLADALVVTIMAGLLRRFPGLAASTPLLVTEVGIGRGLAGGDRGLQRK